MTLKEEITAQLDYLTGSQLQHLHTIIQKLVAEPPAIDQFLDELENIDPDPDKPSLQELSELVKATRQELWG